MERCYKEHNRQLKGIHYDIRMCDYGSIKPCYNKLKNGELGDQESDNDYAWFLDFIIENGEQIKDVIRKDQNEYGSENENRNEDEDEDEYEYEDEDEDVDENNKDPEHLLFFENLTLHAKSYKLKISKDNEEPRFLYYEEQVSSDWCDDLQTCSDDSGDEVTVSEDTQIKQKAKRRRNEKSGRISTKNEVSKRKKINVSIKDKTITQSPVETCHNVSINGANSVVKCKEEPVEYEMSVTTCYSDSDVVILDNVQNCCEVNNKQLVLAEKEPSLRDKLMNILKHPYNEEEYKQLSEYIEKEKPVCQLRPLRNGRSRAFAETGVNKSVLDYGPERFQRMLDAAHKDPPKALNLLRMFRFWLEHAPNDDAFQPWREKRFLKVRPSEKNALTHM